MTRINQTLAFVTCAIILAATGCGDPGSFEDPATEDTNPVADETFSPTDTTPTTDATPTLEEERQLACEGYCEAANFCRRDFFPGDCTEHCADPLMAGADDACIAAEIDLLNCYSATRCDASSEELFAECGDAVLEVRRECELRSLDREDEDIAEIREIEVREVTVEERSEVEDDPEATESGEESGESEDSEPAFELPEIPEFEELPEIGPIIEFP